MIHVLYLVWSLFTLTRYIVVLTHGDLRDDLEDDHVVCIRIDLLLKDAVSSDVR